MRGCRNKSPTKLNVVENKINTSDLFTIEKTTKEKLHHVNLRSPLPRIHYYQNKRLQVKESQYLIPTYS